MRGGEGKGGEGGCMSGGARRVQDFEKGGLEGPGLSEGVG